MSFNANAIKNLSFFEMIVKLKGHIEFISEDFLDVDVQGVVFRVFISKKNIDKI